jgi:hypothetical protein
MTVQYVFRNYLAPASCVAGRTDQKLLRKLRRQGGIIPVIGGVQFGEGDPVLYFIIDALSHRPLFGQEFTARASDAVRAGAVRGVRGARAELGVATDAQAVLWHAESGSLLNGT